VSLQLFAPSCCKPVRLFMHASVESFVNSDSHATEISCFSVAYFCVYSVLAFGISGILLDFNTVV